MTTPIRWILALAGILLALNGGWLLRHPGSYARWTADYFDSLDSIFRRSSRGRSPDSYLDAARAVGVGLCVGGVFILFYSVLAS